ncbi:MAG: TonB-dependent receptor, partial [Melioribacteraceae bacterium]
FLQDEIIFNEKVSLIFGARYDNISYFNESFITSGYGLQTKTFKRITPKAGLTYLLSDSQSLYANYGGGIEVPAGNETDPSGTYGQDEVYLINPLLEPIISNTLEVGTKHLITSDGKDNLVKSISYDAALYYIKVDNDIIPYRGGRFYFTAGVTERLGAELAASIQFKNDLTVNAAFTISDNSYQEYQIDSVHYDLNKAGRFADYKGNKVAGIPGFFYNLGVSYAPAQLKGIFLSFGLNGIGKYFSDDANTLNVPSFSVLNGTLGLTRPIVISGDLAIRGFITVNNIFDLKYASSAFINPDIVNGEAVFLEPGMPRNFVLSISLNY